MTFITNHDENSWNGTVKERLGDAGEAFAVLTYTIPGMPLIYSGQEAGNEKAIRFFEKDTIHWDQIKYQDFYTTLNRLKKENEALWNGTSGGEIVNINSPGYNNVMGFMRQKGNNKVVVALNLSDEIGVFMVDKIEAFDNYKDVFTSKAVKLSERSQMNLEPWSYMVLVSE